MILLRGLSGRLSTVRVGGLFFLACEAAITGFVILISAAIA